MRADHRHELKTNELADWLMHFPEWLKQNRNSLIGTAAILVIVVVVYFWVYYQKNVASARTQVRLTNLVTQLPKEKAEIAQAMGKGDQSYLLIELAKDLQDFAQSTNKREMSALALIERGDTLRSELHYRSGEVSRDEMTKQLTQAQASYEQAMKKAEDVPALAATAHLGMGLCEEEMGNLDKAKETYKAVSENAAYEGTAAKAAAAIRLKTSDDYKTALVFKPAPPKPQPQASAPAVQLMPGQAGAPTVTLTPGDANSAPVVIPIPVNPTPTPAPATEAPKTDASAAPAPAPAAPAPAPATPAPAPAPATNPSSGG